MASYLPALTRGQRGSGWRGHDKGRCRHGVAPEAVITCWPIIPHGVAGWVDMTLSPADQATLGRTEIVLEAHGDLGGRPLMEGTLSYLRPSAQP